MERFEHVVGEVVAYVIREYAPLGVVVGGSLVRGGGGPRSDLDVVVVHRCSWRMREQRVFGDTPVELFINPPAALRAAFEVDHAAARPKTADLLATGRVVEPADPVVHTLVAEARGWLQRPPPPFDGRLARYGVVDLLDDARDLHGVDAAGAAVLEARVVEALATWVARSGGGWVPRRKDVARTLSARDPVTAGLVERWAAAPPPERIHPLTELVRHVLGVDTFFAWRSGPEPVGDPP